MGVPYARLPVEEEDGLRWAFRRRAVSGNCLLFPRRAGTGRAQRAEMTLERQAEVALDSAALLDGFGGASEGCSGRKDRHNLRPGHLYRRPRQDGESRRISR